MNEPKQNDPLTLQSQTGHEENEEIVATESIPHDIENIPIIIDRFVGTVRDSRSYIKAIRMLLEARFIF